MTTEWKLVPVEPTREQLAAAKNALIFDPRVSACAYREMIAAAPVPPAGVEVEVLPMRRSWAGIAPWPVRYQIKGWNECHDAFMPAVTQFQAEVGFLMSRASVLKTERDALKAEVESERKLRRSLGTRVHQLKDWAYDLQSRLTQATAIIDYLWLHTELDAIAKPDIDKFYAGSTDAEKAARAEMARVADGPAEGSKPTNICTGCWRNYVYCTCKVKP